MLGHVLIAGLTFHSHWFPQSPEPADPPAASSTLTQRQCTVLAAGQLGFTPETLAAGGYTTAEVIAILNEVSAENLFSTLSTDQAHDPAPQGGGDAPSEPQGTPAPAPPVEDVRSQVLIASVPNDSAERAARLHRNIIGAAAGLPTRAAAGCVNSPEMHKLAESLIAERRALRLGHALPARHAAFLADIRARAGVIAAAQAVNDHLPAIRAQFATSDVPTPP